ncbi:hypothetical protein HDV05_008032 [Chytridiales sp. JEL 0842]|nr:hypothetical protein HDV05_008032 [Chytridiales sp. JEL 0842]
MSPIKHLYKFPIRTVRDLLNVKLPEGPTSKISAIVHGWVRTVRVQKKVAFAEIADGSTVAGIQAVLDPTLAKTLQTGSSVRLEGDLVSSVGLKQGKELKVRDLKVIGESNPETYPLHKSKLPLEYLRELGHLRSRTRTFTSVLRIRNAAIVGIQNFFQSQQFLQVHTPIITSHDCEGAGEVFRVLSGESFSSHIQTALESANADATTQPKEFTAPKTPLEFFGLPVYLTVSGQLHAELLASAVSRVYTLNPTFRAEKSLSTRHLAEFWMLEAEAAFLTDLDQLLDLIEGCIKSVTKYVLENCNEELQMIWTSLEKKDHLKNLEDIMNAPFARVTYTEAIEILLKQEKKNWEYPVQWGLSLQSEHERFLAEEYFRKPVFVTDYPADVKPFYMLNSPSSQPDNARNTVACTDLLVPGIGELIGGSLREDNIELLEQKLIKAGLSLEDYQWYIDLRRYGSVPHGGFGLGLERYLLYITGLTNVRDVVPSPRWFGHVRY